MLVLSRFVNQVVRIGHDVEVKVVEIRGGKVRLGITAPRQVPVHRSEIYDLAFANRELQQAAAEAEAELDAADSMDGGFRR